MLKQKSLRRHLGDRTSENLTLKEGRHFTVGNVGNNGRIYLRPTVQPAAQRAQQSPFVLPPPTPPKSAPLDNVAFETTDQGLRDSGLSASQLSDSPPRTAKGRLAYNPKRQSVAPSASRSHHRAHSLPTVEDHKTEGQLNNGALKIIIDKVGTSKKSLDGEELPSLEVAIPSYRLGTPRFSTQGTAFLRSSTYTRTSASDYRGSLFARPDFDKLFPTPPGTGEPRPQGHDQNNFLRPPGADVSTTNSVGRVPTTTCSVREPIEPSVFDTLTALIHDPSVVRYNPRTKDITAATPARIVAQISSESFMDYELVSDFFLTFRAYLRPDTLLNLLLARLLWAINRLSDDGRIIRIRTFAALRHWILNYFADDFLPQQALRISFCNQINDMYHQVKGFSVGTSDIKIIMDLKRCWNGRCALYWDSPEFAVDSTPEADIIPGGCTSRNSFPSQSRTEAPDRFSQPQNGLHERRLYDKDLSGRGHAREVSNGTTQSKEAPVSPLSEQSLQPLSCSFPAKSKKSPPPMDTSKGPRPVLVEPTPVSPADNDHPNNKSPGKTEVTHVPLIDQHRASILSNGGSLVRGNVFPPSSPFVDVVAPNSPTNQAFHITAVEDFSEANFRPGNASNPGMKNLLGSIRRALSGKQNGNNPTIQGVDSIPHNPVVKGLTATLPVNVAFQNASLNERRAFRHQVRIDLLCAEAAQSYQDVVSRQVESAAIGIAMGHPSERELGRSERLSDISNGMQSIVIVNDTNEHLPAMSGALQMDRLGASTGARQISDYSVGKQSSGVFGNRRSRSLGPTRRHTEYRQPFRSSSAGQSRFEESTSTTLRRRLSLDGSSDGLAGSINPTGTTLSGVASSEDIDKTPRLLRRRPGGDLRKHQNVHDLEPIVHRQSTGSITTATESMGGSLLVMADKISPIKQPSMMKTHSSQRMRPSFEAAVAGFAQIPDDADGGIESTLLKLEGRYESGMSECSEERSASSEEFSKQSEAKMIDKAHAEGLEVAKIDESVTEATSTSSPNRVSFSPENAMEDQKLSLKPLRSRSKRFSPALRPSLGASHAESDALTSSNPSVEPEFSSVFVKRPTRSDVSIPRPLFSRNNTNETEKPVNSSRSSMELVEETESMKEIPNGLAFPPKSSTNDSFLLDEDEELSDLSSEMSMDIIDRFESPIIIQSELGNIPIHPLAHPPSPPPMFGKTDFYHPPYQKHPPTPDPSPKMETAMSMEMPVKQRREPSHSGHIPFILACDSELLAQQMTIVEKAALSELDWNDLVEMRWNNNNQLILNWADFVSSTGVKGIDLIITRFNLVVKWIISEIVLTQNLQERARTITKYIRVAAHARRFHNYATMLQITIALTSIDCTRLTKTWALVRYYEKQLLRDMEILSQPTRNFYELRNEMEGVDLSDGCIPFVGLYVHDLNYNAQKPSRIASTRDGEPLVNFERYRTTATIVKSLLRLVDASSRYDFKPIEGIIERCLWMAALPDDKIQAMSKALE
ncbi:MAG: hypothetical protein Q9160_002244 [Pyrenula sp. 1 TL-2023]